MQIEWRQKRLDGKMVGMWVTFNSFSWGIQDTMMNSTCRPHLSKVLADYADLSLERVVSRTMLGDSRDVCSFSAAPVSAPPSLHGGRGAGHVSVSYIHSVSKFFTRVLYPGWTAPTRSMVDGRLPFARRQREWASRAQRAGGRHSGAQCTMRGPRHATSAPLSWG